MGLESVLFTLDGTTQELIRGGGSPLSVLVFNPSGNATVWVGDAGHLGAAPAIPVTAGGNGLSMDLHHADDRVYVRGTSGQKVSLLVIRGA